MTKWVVRIVGWLALAAALLWLGDWAIWRVVRHGATDEVEVTRMVVAPLKGGKEEYYPDGTETVECSRSLFAWAGAGACWSVRQHRQVEER